MVLAVCITCYSRGKLLFIFFCFGGPAFCVSPALVRTVEPPVSDHPNCKDLVVAYGRGSFTRIEPQRVSSEKKSRHSYFMEDNLLRAMSKLGYV